jgi:hypothetical protein
MKVQKMFKKPGFLIIALVGIAMLTGCASGPKIQTDYDPSVDFTQYKTFGFFSPMSIEGKNYSTLWGQAFRTSIGREMRRLGYVESNDPDLAINVSARLQDKTRVTTTSDPYMGGNYYGYRRGYYQPWGSYGYGTTTHVSQYTEGTVNIDVVDIAQKRMVWEGVAIGRMKDNRTNKKVRENIDNAVTEMFGGYESQSKR